MKDGKMVILAVVGIVLFAGSAMAAELTVTKQGTGYGTVSGVGIHCGESCQENYPDETILHLEATPDEDSEFLGWLVDGEPHEGTLVIRKDITVTAIFERTIQVKEFEIVGTRPFTLVSVAEDPPPFPLGNSRGEIVGSRQLVYSEDTVENFIAIEGGASFRLYPLTAVVVSKNENRIIAYGSHVDNLNMRSEVNLKIYSGTGELIRTVETGMWWHSHYSPVGVEDNGGVWITGRKNYTTDVFLLKRYSLDGELLWENQFPSDKPTNEPSWLVVSLDNQYAAIMLSDWTTFSNQIFYYDQNGNLLHTRGLPPSFSAAVFVSYQKVVLFSSDRWELYHLDDLDTPLITGKFRGGLFEPIIAFPQENSFLAASVLEKHSQKGCLLQAIHTDTGQVIAEHYFEGYSHQNFQFFRITTQGTVEFLLNESEIVEVKFP